MKIALRDVEKEFEVDIDVENIKYASASFQFNLQVSKLDVDTNYLNWADYCERYDLTPKDYNRILEVEGEQLQLLALDTFRRRYPIRCLNLRTGNEISYTVQAIQYAIEQAEK